MKKGRRLLAIPLMLIMIILMASPVLAEEETVVEVKVITPDKVDLEVEIIAGGPVTAIVDGVNLQEYASKTDSAYRFATKTTYGKRDFVMFWELTGVGPDVNGRIADLQGAMNFVLAANAKLIEAVDQEAISINNLEDYADMIFDQLMNGAEYHISLLDAEVGGQSEAIKNMEAEIDYLKACLEVSNANANALREYSSVNQEKETRYFWIGGAIIAFVIMWAMWMSFRRVFK